MSNIISNKPEIGPYKPLTPFRFWCQKVIPLVYDESLSYYELLCKVIEYLNNTMADVNTAINDIMEINNYLTDPGIEALVDQKLDEMAADGTLTRLLLPYLFYVTPEMYGAVGDGETDDSAAFQEAVNSGKNVLIPNKTYKCKNIIVSTSNIAIIGTNAVLEHDEGHGFLIGDDVENVVIKNIISYCDFTAGSALSANAHIVTLKNNVTPSEYSYTKNVKIENCQFIGGVFGVVFNSSIDCVVDKCIFKGLVYKPQDLAGGYGVLLQSCINTTVKNCKFYIGNYGRHDVYVAVDGDKLANIKCVNTVIDNCLFDHSGMEVENNEHYSPNTACINIRVSDGTTITKCKAKSACGLVAINSEQGDIIGLNIDDCVIDSPVYLSGTSETKYAINLGGDITKVVKANISNISLINVPNDYTSFLYVNSGEINVDNCNISTTRFIINQKCKINVNNIITDISYYIFRFYADCDAKIKNLRYPSNISSLFEFNNVTDISKFDIDERIDFTLTPNENYTFTNLVQECYLKNKVVYINLRFQTPDNDIPGGTDIFEAPFNFGVLNASTYVSIPLIRHTTLLGTLFILTNKIRANSAIPTSSYYTTINIVWPLK